MIDLTTYQPSIAALCRRLNVERLGVFGSVLRPEFTQDSDIDVVVRFDRRPGRMFTRYFDLKEGLEIIFGRTVDVVVEDAIRNPYFKQSVDQNRVNIYES